MNKIDNSKAEAQALKAQLKAMESRIRTKILAFSTGLDEAPAHIRTLKERQRETLEILEGSEDIEELKEARQRARDLIQSITRITQEIEKSGKELKRLRKVLRAINTLKRDWRQFIQEPEAIEYLKDILNK